MGPLVQKVYAQASIKPTILRQKLSEQLGFDLWNREMLTWCAQTGMYFQSIWSLTEKFEDLLECKLMREMAAKYRVTPRALFLRFLMGRRTVSVTSSLSPKDLQACQIPLAAQDNT